MGAWDDATDKQLLLIVIQLTAPSVPKWDQVAAAMGDGYTSESVRQHFQKLRKNSAKAIGTASGSDGAAAPKTPSKRTAGKKAAGEASGKSSGKRKASKADVDAGEADGDDDESPTKKLKAEVDADEFD